MSGEQPPPLPTQEELDDRIAGIVDRFAASPRGFDDIADACDQLVDVIRDDSRLRGVRMSDSDLWEAAKEKVLDVYFNLSMAEVVHVTNLYKVTLEIQGIFRMRLQELHGVEVQLQALAALAAHVNGTQTNSAAGAAPSDVPDDRIVGPNANAANVAAPTPAATGPPIGSRAGILRALGATVDARRTELDAKVKARREKKCDKFPKTKINKSKRWVKTRL